MINVAVQQGTPSSAPESRPNGSCNYGPTPSLSGRLRHNGQQQNGNQNSAPKKARDVYQSVVVPTIFPGQPPSSPPVQRSQSQLQTTTGLFYSGQCCIVGPNNNNSKQALYQQGTAVATVPVYQQWSTSPSVGYSFMQQQLHQYRQQQLPQQRSPASTDRTYVYHGLKKLSSTGPAALPIGLRSPILQSQRTANVRLYDPTNLVNPMASHSQQSTPSPSPKRSSRRHHHGHHHHYHFGQTSGGAYDLLEPEALQRRHRFPTNFCRMLREYPPPVPPILLRAMPAISATGSKAAPASALPRYKDPANRLKITLRVLSSAATATDGGAGSPEASFVAVDSRKKQITLMEQAQQPQRQPLSSVSQHTPSGASTAMVPKIFGFDAVFSPDDSQTEICSTTLTEIIQTVVNEGDGCVLMFGSSDQGKSHTAIGSDSSAQTLGILPCAVSWLYRLISEIRQRTGARFSIRVSAVEVAGPQEELRDLLADLTGVANNGADPSNSNEACLRDDPVFGTQLHNVSELRAPTPDKAAFYLDAALAKRRSGSDEERRNSHFFYTLHIYQYRVNDKQQHASDETGADAVVAGGRTRLHLIDLGAGEKNSKPGRASLTLPALGNVLLTLLQGQKHLPFKESKVTQILKSCIGSASCKAVSVVACASSDPERKMETVNVVQIAGRLYRIRRTKRGSAKFGLGAGNSSGGESSTDDRSGRRRFPRSASDPDCTTSSSEQSCDTVIYLGAGGARSRTGSAVGGVPTSVAISDQDIPPPGEKSDSAVMPNSPMKTGVTTTPRETPKKAHITGRQSVGGSPSGHKQMAFVQPAVISSAANSKLCEQWIDGPKASKQPKLILGPMETAADAAVQNLKTFAHLGYASDMDPFKREMIRQWVVHQEQERATFVNGAGGEVWIDRSPKAAADLVPVGNFDGTGARPKQFPSFGHQRQPPEAHGGQEDRASIHSVSMETSSSARSSSCSDVAVMETRDIGLQCCEEEIDIDCGRYNIPLSILNAGDMVGLDNGYTYQHNNNTINQEYAAVATWTEPEMRMLEDIAEVEEEENTTSTVSGGTPMIATRHSSSLRATILVTAASGSPPYRNEAMAPRPATSEGGIPVLLTAPSTSSLHSVTHGTDFIDDDEHPLRILSKEKIGGGSRSDTFSLDNEDVTDAFSLPTSEMFAFLGGQQALMTNAIRGKLSADEDSSSLTDEDLERAMQASLTSIRSHEILEKLKSEGKLRRTDQGDEDQRSMRDDLSDKASSRKASFGHPPRPEPEGFNDEEIEKASQKQSKIAGQKSMTQNTKPLLSDKLTKPTVPQLSKPVANLVTSQLISGLANSPVHNQKEEKVSTSRVVAAKPQQHLLSGKQHLPSPSPISVCANDEQENRPVHAESSSPQPHTSLPRPTKLPSPRSQDRQSSQPAGPAVKIPSTKQQKDLAKVQARNDKEKSKAATPPIAKIPPSAPVKNASKPSTPSGPGTSATPTFAPTTGSATAERTKAKPSSSNSVLKSPIMSFLRSPSKFKKPTPAVPSPPTAITTTKATPMIPSQHSTAANGTSTLSPPTVSTSPSKRASSGYDSGHDSGIVTVDSPDLLLASPYSKVTRPRASQRSSSGHGSDNSSAVSSDAGGASAALSSGKLGRACVTKLASVTKKASPIIGAKTAVKKSLDRDANGGCASSSGYESAAGYGRTNAEAESLGIPAATTSPESGSDVDHGDWAQDRIRSPPSVKLHRKKWLDGFGFDASKSRSAPQSPNGSVISPAASSRSRILQSQYAAETSLDGQPMLKGIDLKQQRIAAVENLKMRQRELKRELKQAKDRLGVPQSKWSYDLHVADCMDITNPNMLEALHQETRILEKRVAACKSHILMVTVFDAVPSVPTSPNTARKCS